MGGGNFLTYSMVLWGIAYDLLTACAGGDALGQLDGDYDRDGLCYVILNSDDFTFNKYFIIFTQLISEDGPLSTDVLYQTSDSIVLLKFSIAF